MKKVEVKFPVRVKSFRGRILLFVMKVLYPKEHKKGMEKWEERQELKQLV